MEELYVRCNKKARADKLTYTKEQVTSPDFTDDYGRIVPPGYVVFDFDKQPYINIIYKILTNSKYKFRILKTTKGYHFMFRTTLNKAPDFIQKFNWIGLQCDIKACGTKETKQSYQTIRINGETREETLFNTEDWWDLDFAPRWMYCVSNKKADQIDLTVEQTGGRNNMFHGELMIKAKKNGFSYEEYCEMAFTINDFVIPTPLPEDELNTAIRPEEWDNLQIGSDKMQMMDQVEDVINQWNCILGGESMAYFNPELERYATDLYPIKHYLQEKYRESSITINKMEEVLEQVNIIMHDVSKYHFDRSEEYVLCNKELVSFWKDEVKPSTRTIYTDIYYPYSIMSEEEFEAFNGRAKSFMQEISCGNKDIENVIWECIGCMLAPSKTFGKIFILYGSGNNGKSLLLKLIMQIMGDKMTFANILNINDKFALEPVIYGICNVTDDVGVTTLRETGLIKSLIDGSKVEVNRKYKGQLWWEPQSQFVICCNELPKINDTTNGMIRRLAFIPFDLELPKDKIDRTLYQKMKMDPDNLRYLMTGGIFAHRRAFKRRAFTGIRETKRARTNIYRRKSRPNRYLYGCTNR